MWETHKIEFEKNYPMFVKMGCYKDCLVLAKRVREKGGSVSTMLKPLVVALMDDENSIRLGNLQNLSLASKWAPRQGKKYAEFIPDLKKMCGIKGGHVEWRKFLKKITSKCPATAEHILSNKASYDDSKSFTKGAIRLYSSVLDWKKVEKLKNANPIKTSKCAHEIVKTYFPGGVMESKYITATEDNWKRFVNHMHTPRDNIYIPIVNTKKGMFMNGCGSIAISMSLIMSLTNPTLSNIMMKYSNNSEVMNIKGRTLIENVYDVIFSNWSSVNELNLESTLLQFLNYIVSNNVEDEVVKRVKLVVMTNGNDPMRQFGRADTMLEIKIRYGSNGYTMPKIIIWNMKGSDIWGVNVSDHVEYIKGFDHIMFEQLRETGVIDTKETRSFRVKQYHRFVKN